MTDLRLCILTPSVRMLISYEVLHRVNFDWNVRRPLERTQPQVQTGEEKVITAEVGFRWAVFDMVCKEKESSSLFSPILRMIVRAFSVARMELL